MPAANADGAHADVLIVGAGASGAVAARSSPNAASGSSASSRAAGSTPPTSPATSPNGSSLRRRAVAPDPNVRGLPADYPCEVSDADVTPLMFNARRRQHDPLRRRTGSGCCPPTSACGRSTASPTTGRSTYEELRALLRAGRARLRRVRARRATRPTRRAPARRSRRMPIGKIGPEGGARA